VVSEFHSPTSSQSGDPYFQRLIDSYSCSIIRCYIVHLVVLKSLSPGKEIQKPCILEVRQAQGLTDLRCSSSIEFVPVQSRKRRPELTFKVSNARGK
jgi:hypothetical protein